MRWPLVSRRAYDDCQARLAQSEEERRELQQQLLERPQIQVRPEPQENEGESKPFTTPIDSVLLRFDRAHKNRPIDAKFKASLR